MRQATLKRIVSLLSACCLLLSLAAWPAALAMEAQAADVPVVAPTQAPEAEAVVTEAPATAASPDVELLS